MHQFLSFWWRCARIAAKGSFAFANDWQWLFGIPILAGLFSYIRGTATVTFFSNAIIDGIVVAAIVFAITWLVGLGIRLANAPVRLFYREKDRADAATHALTEKTTPKFTVSFDQEHRGIVVAVERTEIVQPGVYGGTRVTAGPSFSASYLRISVIATSAVAIKNCQAFILFLEKQTNPNETFIHINLPQPIALASEPFDVMPSIPRMVDFMKASEQDNKLTRTGYWPYALANCFSDTATYRFTIAVNGDGVTAKPIKVDVVWQGVWNRIPAHQVDDT